MRKVVYNADITPSSVEGMYTIFNRMRALLENLNVEDGNVPFGETDYRARLGIDAMLLRDMGVIEICRVGVEGLTDAELQRRGPSGTTRLRVNASES